MGLVTSFRVNRMVGGYFAQVAQVNEGCKVYTYATSERKDILGVPYAFKGGLFTYTIVGQRVGVSFQRVGVTSGAIIVGVRDFLVVYASFLGDLFIRQINGCRVV